MAQNTQIEEYFDSIGDNITLDKNKKLVTNNYNSWIGDAWNTVYGATILSGESNKTYETKFKIITKNSSTSAINIGIECDQWNNLNTNFIDQYSNPDGEYYAYCSNGKKYSHEDGCKYGKSFADSYGNNDIIHMKLQFISGVDYGLLHFKKNDLQWEDSHFKIKKTKKIKIAVSLRSASYFDGGQSSLELISFSISDTYQNKNDNNDEKSDEMAMITIHDESNPSEQSDTVQLKMQISSLKEQLNAKQEKCVSLEKQNHLLRDERDKMQSQSHQLMQQIEKYKQNVNEETKMDDNINESKLQTLEENNNIKNDLKCLEKQLSAFSVNYDNNAIDAIYDKSYDALMVNKEINALDLRLKSFGKYLMDIKGYIDTLTTPDIEKYKEWNVNEMLQWVSLLDNGKYKKYLDVFRKGFESDGIQAGNLPDLDKNTLRGEPFNIVNFPDRKGLEEHFKSLVKENINAQNEQIYNAENTEGSVTEYHS